LEIDPTRICELLVGLPSVDVVGIEDVDDDPLKIHIRCRHLDRWCWECGSWSVRKDRPTQGLVDLPAFGRPTRLVWHQHRWACPQALCSAGSWTQTDSRIGWARMKLTDRAGRWVTQQVGRYARSISQ